MIRMVRILGVLLMTIGVIVILSWLIEPLRRIWPLIFDWFRSMPTPVQLGLVVAALGFLLLFSSLIWERIEDSKSEGSLLDDES